MTALNSNIFQTARAQYRIEQELQRGGMGVVYRAQELATQRPVAIKLIQNQGLDVEARLRFEREAKALDSLSHSNIVKLWEYGELPSGPFIVMEWLDGQDLSVLLADPKRPLENQYAGLAVIFSQVASALQFSHQQGLIHRDLKPQNIILETKTERAVVIDFGLAAEDKSQEQLGQESMFAMSLTKSHETVGTLLYMAPEQLQGHRELTPAVDVWALGVTLYECLTGRSPFSAASMVQSQKNIGSAQYPAAETLNPDIPPQLAALTRDCIQLEPQQRPTMEEVIERLENWQQRPEPLTGATGRPWLLAISLVILAVLPLSLYLVFKPKKQPSKTQGQPKQMAIEPLELILKNSEETAQGLVLKSGRRLHGSFNQDLLVTITASQGQAKDRLWSQDLKAHEDMDWTVPVSVFEDNRVPELEIHAQGVSTRQSWSVIFLDPMASSSVSLEHLLFDLTSPQSLTLQPTQAFQSLTVDSHLRLNKRDQDYELLNVNGPGALTSLQLSVSEGRILIFCDGQEQPLLSWSLSKLSRQDLSQSWAPLIQIYPNAQLRKRPDVQKIHFLNLNAFMAACPCPFQRQCRVVYRLPAEGPLNSNLKRAPLVMARIQYRAYESDTKLTVIDSKSLEKGLLAAAARLRQQAARAAEAPTTWQPAVVVPGHSLTTLAEHRVAHSEPRPENALAVTDLVLRLGNIQSFDPRVWQLRLVVAFDGQRMVDVPLPLVFGTEFPERHKSWLVRALDSKTWRLRMVMPFRRSVRLAILNDSDQALQAQVSWSLQGCPWNDRRCYFQAAFSASKGAAKTGQRWLTPEFQGPGHIVGLSTLQHNPLGFRWPHGHFRSEQKDSFANSKWQLTPMHAHGCYFRDGRNEKIRRPPTRFHGSESGFWNILSVDTRDHSGVNHWLSWFALNRMMVADKWQLSYTLERPTWVHRTRYFQAFAVFAYGPKAGFLKRFKLQQRRPSPRLRLTDLVEAVEARGDLIVEGESLQPTSYARATLLRHSQARFKISPRIRRARQDWQGLRPNPRHSLERVLFLKFHKRPKQDPAEFKFRAPPGRYQACFCFSVNRDSGTFEISINGQSLGRRNLFHPGHCNTGDWPLGEVSLKSENTLSIKYIEHDPRCSKRKGPLTHLVFSLDYMRFKRL